ncbi:hypothetical protein [Allokutzneria multivorans]|uniref:hypothetical protein n=1 Tax=Allokutzneria multivorans TaxID=1142134 RepID=UPI0031F034D2
MRNVIKKVVGVAAVALAAASISPAASAAPTVTSIPLQQAFPAMNYDVVWSNRVAGRHLDILRWPGGWFEVVLSGANPGEKLVGINPSNLFPYNAAEAVVQPGRRLASSGQFVIFGGLGVSFHYEGKSWYSGRVVSQ